MKPCLITRGSKSRGTYIVEWEGGHAVFADLKRARAFKEGFNTALKSRIK